MQGFVDKMLFLPVHYRDIPEECREHILNSLSGYKDRIGQPTGKARVFVDGSKQLDEIVGDSYCPVARIESVMCLLGIAAFRHWKICSYDVKQAYTRVRRPAGDPYRFVRLAKDITKVVTDLDPGMKAYVTDQGNLFVEWEWMIYGDKKAGRLWYESIMAMYKAIGFEINKADPCIIHYTSAKGTIYGAVTVDDTLFAYSSEDVLDEIHDAYIKAYGEDGFTMEKERSFSHLGMVLSQDLDDGSIAVEQKEFVQALLEQSLPMCEKYGYHRGGTPADGNIFHDPDSPTLNEEDKDVYRSLNMSLMYVATRTYPECLPVATACAARFTRATEEDMRRLLKGIRYLQRDPNHCLTIRPGSETLVCSADCSYASHADGYSHDGIAVGFEGAGKLPDSFLSLHQENKVPSQNHLVMEN